MSGKKQLPPVDFVPPVRLVGNDERPPEVTAPLTLSEASESGNRLDELRAMRRILIAHMESENTLARDLAALTRQVREISKEVEEIEAQEAEAKKSGQSGPQGTSRLDSEDQEFDPHSV